MIYFTANTRNATANSDDSITSGSVGIPVTVSLSDDFDDLTTIMTFKAGNICVDRALTGTTTTVPLDVLEYHGRYLYIGVYAADSNGTVAIPTIWASAGMIYEGVLPSGVSPSDPEPSWAIEVQETAQSVREDADSGAFTPEFSIGNVQTLPAGSNASVTMTGTTLEPVLNFGIPSGSGGNKASVTIASSSWAGNGPYTYTPTISGYSVTANTMADLRTDHATIDSLAGDGVQLIYAYNNAGTITVYAVGAKPTTNITVDIVLYEIASLSS